MAPVEKKRHRDLASFRAKKRQRIDHKNGNSGEKQKDVAVGLDELPWNQVAVDRLEDGEGFFGLEELSDVDVVKDPSLGRVKYKLLSNKSAHKRLEESSTSDDVARIEETEWEGFGEEKSEDQAAVPRSRATVSLGKDTRRTEKKTWKQEKKQKKKALSQLETRRNTFEALGRAEDNEDLAGDEEGDVSAWGFLHLSSQTISSLARMRFSQPTAIQRSTIPDILGGHDVIGKAPTGSGKTLAFGIPIYEHYLKTTHGEVRSAEGQSKKQQQHPLALILSPTRELAHQLSAHLTLLCSAPSSNGLSIATLTGGLSVHKQQRQLAYADIIIGTPGRLWEVISGSQSLISALRKIKFLVVDEADRLLSEGHFREVEEILNVLDRTIETNDRDEDNSETIVWKQQRQTLVFSATFQKDLQQKLAGRAKSISGDLMGKSESLEYLLKRLTFREEKPRFIDVNPITPMASGLKEGIVECSGTEKDLYLYSTLLLHPNSRTLIFTNSISSVRRLTPFLQNLNLPAYALHSQMPQKARLRSIERFSSASSPSSILIATDVAARGLDIPAVHLILHYHLPRTADMYVHRSGRTARAEKSGLSILLCSAEEVQGMRRLITKVHARNASDHDSDGRKFFMRTIDLDARVVSRLKPRVTLSKKISDASLAKEKKGHEDNWLKTAADDLGVDYDSEEFAVGEASKKGRGQGRKKKEKEARALTKGELGALKGELKGLLDHRVNVGVSERYLTAGGVDVDELLNGGEGEFLGRIEGGLDDL